MEKKIKKVLISLKEFSAFLDKKSEKVETSLAFHTSKSSLIRKISRDEIFEKEEIVNIAQDILREKGEDSFGSIKYLPNESGANLVFEIIIN